LFVSPFELHLFVSERTAAMTTATVNSLTLLWLGEFVVLRAMV